MKISWKYAIEEASTTKKVKDSRVLWPLSEGKFLFGWGENITLLDKTPKIKIEIKSAIATNAVLKLLHCN